MEQFKDTMDNQEIVRIGKNLLTEGLIKQIKELVKSKGMIKIKILKSAYETKTQENIIAQIINETGFYLLDLRGHTFIISKRPVPGLKISRSCKNITELSKGL